MLSIIFNVKPFKIVTSTFKFFVKQVGVSDGELVVIAFAIIENVILFKVNSTIFTISVTMLTASIIMVKATITKVIITDAKVTTNRTLVRINLTTDETTVIMGVINRTMIETTVTKLI